MSTTTSQPLDPALYESRAGVPIAVVTVSLTLATTAVCLRTYARAVMIRQFGADDWAAIVALVLALGSGIMVASNTANGQGHHLAVVDPSILWKYFRTFYISIVLYNGSLTATKVTFLLQYYRILGTGPMRKAIIIAFVLIALWSISQLLVVIFTCSPIEKFWLSDTPGTCIPNLPFWYINAAGNILTDVTVFVLPLPALSRLNLRKTQKVGLIAVFCLGFFTCAISVLRIQYLKLSSDVTWDNVDSSCWSIGELSSGITCACLPTLRPLISKCLPGMRSQSGGPSGDNNNNNKYYRQSSGRDGVRGISNNSGSGLGSAARNGSSRGIVYPEDLELQSDDRSDKEIRVNVLDRVGSTGMNVVERGGPSNPSSNSSLRTPAAAVRNGRTMDKLKLGLRSTVRTEVKVGSPGRGTEGIQVKRDFFLSSRDGSVLA